MNAMEKSFEKILEEIESAPGVTGCIITDHSGLALGTRGKPVNLKPGIIAAIAEQASKIESHGKTPTIHFENDSHSFTIQRSGTVTCAVYRSLGKAIDIS
nr:uncharacterized protein LOC111517407 [Leptinotarsa decemlineata]